MLWKFKQNSFVGGRLDRELAGRQDLEQYYKGASELKNFVIRRQGYISKRRGTDFVMALNNIVAEGGEVRILPMTAERDKGYYVLLAAGKAYLVDGDTISGNCTIPYADDDLAQIDYTQSGDTLFLCHRSYPPARIVRTATGLAYSRLSFSNNRWARPKIVNIVGTGFSTSTDVGSKTVTYVCTYVKDGIESQPSLPFSFTYKTPWPDKASVSITCDKGTNKEEPDYYNVYKKDSVGFGVISTAGAENKVILYPTSSVNSIAYYQRNAKESKPRWDALVLYRDFNSFLNTSSKGLLESYDNHIGARLTGSYHEMTGSGGYASKNASSGIVYSFGQSSGSSVTKFLVETDALTGWRTGYLVWKLDLYQSGTLFRGTLRVKDKTGAYTDFSKDVSAALISGFPVGHTERSYSVGSSKDNPPQEALNLISTNRTLEFDFLDQIKAKFGAEPTADYGYEIVSFTVKSFVSDSDMTPVTMYARGVKFYDSYGQKKVVIDDYISPDLTMTPPQISTHFETAGAYPACVAINQQRLCFASSNNDPFKFWMSCVGDLYNFDVHASIREDDAISAELSSTEFPNINHIVTGRDLLFLADNGEWKIAPVSGNTLSYKTVSSSLQSTIGCSKTLKPINVGDEVVFVTQTGETLMATRYNFTSDGYESQDLSVLSQWIFKQNPIIAMAYRQNPDSTLECVLKDGTIASLVYMKEHEVCAWSRHELGGGWKAVGVATNKAIRNGSTEVMFVVERNGQYQLWRLRDDISVRGEVPAREHICLDGIREVDENFNTEDGMRVVRVGDQIYVGYEYEAELTTIRPEPKGGGDSVQHELKNATHTAVRVIDSGSFTIGAKGVADSKAKFIYIPETIDESGNMKLVEGDYDTNLVGLNTRDGRIVVKSKNFQPLNILSVETTYQIEPADLNGGDNG